MSSTNLHLKLPSINPERGYVSIELTRKQDNTGYNKTARSNLQILKDLFWAVFGKDPSRDYNNLIKKVVSSDRFTSEKAYDKLKKEYPLIGECLTKSYDPHSGKLNIIAKCPITRVENTINSLDIEV